MPDPPDSQDRGARPDPDEPGVSGRADVVAVGGGILGLNARGRTSSRVVRRDDLRAEVGSDTYIGGLVVEGSGGLHPGRYVAGLIRAARDAGVTLRPWTRARRVRKTSGRFHVETSRGPIEAANVV